MQPPDVCVQPMRGAVYTMYNAASAEGCAIEGELWELHSTSGVCGACILPRQQQGLHNTP